MPLTYFAKYHACPGFLPISPGPISPPNPLAAATTGDLVASALPSPAPPGASGFVTRGDAISPSLLSPPPRRTPHLLLKHFPSRCYPWRPSSPSIIFAPYSAQPLLSVRSGCCRLACPQRPQCRCFRAKASSLSTSLGALVLEARVVFCAALLAARGCVGAPLPASCGAAPVVHRWRRPSTTAVLPRYAEFPTQFPRNTIRCPTRPSRHRLSRRPRPHASRLCCSTHQPAASLGHACASPRAALAVHLAHERPISRRQDNRHAGHRHHSTWPAATSSVHSHPTPQCVHCRVRP